MPVLDAATDLALQARAVVETIPETELPVRVQRWDVEFGTDSTNDEAFWVIAVVDAERIPHGTLGAMSRAIREAVSASGIRPGAWTYVSLRTVSEDA